MQNSMIELMEDMGSGLLWCGRDGKVRYANADARRRTGLSTGGKVFDPDLSRAIVHVVDSREAAELLSAGTVSRPGTAVPELSCRVIPGFGTQDAFVLIARDPLAMPGTPFENLMQVIKSELRQPLMALRQTLQAAEARTEAAQVMAAGTELKPALDPLLQVLERIVELASLWGSEALIAEDRIEVWTLLDAVWADLSPAAGDRRIQVRGSSAVIYGSEAWLHRVFRECLSSALRSSRPGSTLAIEHHQMGGRVLIVFRDSGVFGTRQRGAGATTAGAGTARSTQDEIGLRLCQHIVALHGGQLREESEDGQRNFMIELPTGAPHGAAQTQLDPQQVERYARDLAALMARRQATAPAPLK